MISVEVIRKTFLRNRTFCRQNLGRHCCSNSKRNVIVFLFCASFFLSTLISLRFRFGTERRTLRFYSGVYLFILIFVRRHFFFRRKVGFLGNWHSMFPPKPIKIVPDRTCCTPNRVTRNSNRTEIRKRNFFYTRSKFDNFDLLFFLGR